MFKFNPLSGVLDLIRPLVIGDMILQGEFDASGGVLPPDVSSGYYWTVTVAGTIGSLTLDIGDSLIAKNTVVGVTADTDFFKVDAVGDPIIADTISERTPNAGVTVDNLPIKDAGFNLAGSTDGDIYQRNAGVLQRIGIGGNGEVLTSDGITASWQPAGGGGGASQFDATVGATGADYTTVQAAVVAGKTSLLVIDNTTEINDTSIPVGGLSIHITKGFILDMVSFKFQYSSVENVYIRGQGTIKTTTTNTGFLFNNASFFTSIVDIDGITWDLNHSVSGTYRLTQGVEHLRNMTIFLPNQPSGLGNTGGSSSDNQHWENIHFIGGGTNSYLAIDFTGSSSVLGTRLNNILFTGSFAGSAGQPIVNFQIDQGMITNVQFNATASGGTGYFNVSGLIRGFNAVGSSISFDIKRPGTILSDIDLFNGNLTIGNTFSSYNEINNLTTGGNLILSSSNTRNILMSNCRFNGTSALSISGDDNKFSNCFFRANMTFVSGSTGNQFTGCQLDGSLTLNSGADNNIFTGTKIIGAITDNGIGNVVNDGIPRYGDMHLHNNVIATVINTVNIAHMVQGLFALTRVNNFTFNVGSTGAITAMASGVNTTITSTAHGLANGDIVSISGTTSYNGVFVVSAVTANTFDISATFVANDATGNWYQGDNLTVGTGSDGIYKLEFYGSGSSANNNRFFQYDILVNGIAQPHIEARRKYNSAGDIGSFSGGGIIQLNAGDIINFAVTGLTDITNFTFNHANIVAHKI